jgi:putative ABC transport system substrate-binding protein
VVPTPKNFEDAITGMLPYVDILVVWSTLGAVAARNVRTTVPTVFLSVGAPVNIGIVQSLAHPGGNMTGVTFEAATETYGKRLQILKEIAPGLSRVAVLQGAGDANVPFAMSALEQAAPALGVKLLPMDIKSVDDLEAAFLGMRREQAEALIVVAGALTFTGTKEIANLALQHKLPSCHAFKEAVAAGGLVSLGPDSIAMARQGATYIDRIMGTEPADLPVEQPARYELHVNLSAAKALGITVPPSLLVRADEVIE